MSTYKKPYLTFEQQLELLVSRGLTVTNRAAALEYLRRLGYYRLSGYWYPFREYTHSSKKPLARDQRKDTFIPGAKFQDAVELYIFDKKLRLLVLDAIERIEVAFRVDIAYLLGAKDAFAHTSPSFLHGNFTKKTNSQGRTRHEDWLIKQEQLTNRSKEDFVQHYKDKYGLPLPIWVAIELWDFGLLSTFYQGMTVEDKTKIAAKYGIPDWQIMESWLRCLNYVRNVVAHHSRLWNKNLIDQPKLPKPREMLAFDPLLGNTHITSRVYVVLCILAHFMSHVCPRSSWPIRVRDLIQSFPHVSLVGIRDMGFPKNWDHHVFFKGSEFDTFKKALVV